MRYRDHPTVQVEERISGDPSLIWEAVTDIELPVGVSAELQSVEWLDGATEVAVGSRFRGNNANSDLGEWSTESTVIEVEPGARWVWQVNSGDDVMATWGFEVDPGRDAVTVRQWARRGPDPSGLSIAIERMPDKEGRIVSRRLEQWRTNMAANLAALKARIEDQG
jgi:hypothetical protein